MGNGTYWDGEQWSTVQVDSPFDKAKVFILPEEPTTGPMRTGDLFIDTDTHKIKYRSGSSWVSVSDLEARVITLEAQVAALMAP